MDPRIRIGSSADASLLADLLTDFNREFESAVPDRVTLTERFGRILAEPTVIAVIAETTIAAGFALVTLRPTPYADGPLAQLDELYVVPDLRGLGIGSLILAAAVAEVTDRGTQEMHIDVDEIDEDARRFYERHGFVNIEPGRDYRMLCYLREF